MGVRSNKNSGKKYSVLDSLMFCKHVKFQFQINLAQGAMRKTNSAITKSEACKKCAVQGAMRLNCFLYQHRKYRKGNIVFCSSGLLKMISLIGL